MYLAKFQSPELQTIVLAEILGDVTGLFALSNVYQGWGLLFNKLSVFNNLGYFFDRLFRWDFFETDRGLSKVCQVRCCSLWLCNFSRLNGFYRSRTGVPFKIGVYFGQDFRVLRGVRSPVRLLVVVRCWGYAWRYFEFVHRWWEWKRGYLLFATCILDLISTGYLFLLVLLWFTRSGLFCFWLEVSRVFLDLLFHKLFVTIIVLILLYLILFLLNL